MRERLGVSEAEVEHVYDETVTGPSFGSEGKLSGSNAPAARSSVRQDTESDASRDGTEESEDEVPRNTRVKKKSTSAGGRSRTTKSAPELPTPDVVEDLEDWSDVD